MNSLAADLILATLLSLGVACTWFLRGREVALYRAARAESEVLAKVGKSLNHTVDNFNELVGKMDNLLVPGRELSKLLALHGDLPQIEIIDTSVREVRFRNTVAANSALTNAMAS